MINRIRVKLSCSAWQTCCYLLANIFLPSQCQNMDQQSIRFQKFTIIVHTDTNWMQNGMLFLNVNSNAWYYRYNGIGWHLILTNTYSWNFQPQISHVFMPFIINNVIKVHKCTILLHLIITGWVQSKIRVSFLQDRNCHFLFLHPSLTQNNVTLK